MSAVRVRTATGTHVEPPLEQSWTQLRKLQWHAEVASFDTGLSIVVTPTTKLMPQTYMVTIVGHCGHSDRPFMDAWTLINGISSGAQAVRAASP